MRVTRGVSTLVQQTENVIYDLQECWFSTDWESDCYTQELFQDNFFWNVTIDMSRNYLDVIDPDHIMIK